MRRLNEYFVFQTFTLSAILVAFPLFATSQASTPIPDSTAQPLKSPVASQIHTAPPTPEELGDSFMSHQRYQAAIEAYKKAPHNSAAVWNKMGIAYQMMFNSDDALRCYRESLKVDSKNANVWNNMGTIYDSQRQYSQAVKMYHKALKLDPKSPLVLKNLGTDLLAQHKYAKGWVAYQAAIALDPTIFGEESGPRVENPSSLQQRGAMNYYMAKSCVRAGMNARAIEYLRMALIEGFISPKKIEADSEFAGLREIPAFKQLLAEQRNP